jgi:hypothetical protein
MLTNLINVAESLKCLTPVIKTVHLILTPNVFLTNLLW